MLVLPADTGLTTPVLELIVATAVFDDDHTIVPAMEVRFVIVEPMHTSVPPVIADAIGKAFTVTACVAEVDEQLLPSVTV